VATVTAKEHNNMLGIFFLVYEGIQILGLVIVALVMFGMMGFMFSVGPDDAMLPMGFVTLVLILTLIFSTALMVPVLIAGLKLRRERPDARTWGIIASVIALLNFPLGTALGVYGLWFLAGDVGKDFYLTGGSGNYSYNPPKPPPPSSWQ